MIDKKIGDNLRTLRENAKYTQTNLSNFLGVDQSLISKIEKGERGLTAEMLEKLASLYGVTVGQIENEVISKSNFKYAFRGNQLSAEEMKVISIINKIALNSEFMRVQLLRISK